MAKEPFRRVCLGSPFLSEKCVTSRQGDSIKGPNSRRRSKLGAHLFKHKQEVGKVNWKWGDIILMPVPSEGLPLARLNHLKLLKQQHQLGTRHPNACGGISHSNRHMPPTDVHSSALRCYGGAATAYPARLYFFFFLIDFLA